MKMMRYLLIVFAVLSSAMVATAEKFDYTKVIAPPIKAMGPPEFWNGVGNLNLLVSTGSKVAEEHVKQGFALLHGQWDVEAYRHFSRALEYDENCLLAYCGVVLSILNPEHEWKAYRNVALNRLITLIEHKKEAKEGEVADYSYPENERGFAIAIAKLLTEGHNEGLAAISLLSELYPNDIQFALLAPFLGRGSYDIFGEADGRQKGAINRVKEILDEHPENPMTLNFYIMMQIDAPYNAIDQKAEVLPYARKIVKVSKGDLPTWHMLHGYVAWRSGEIEEAKAAYEKAMVIYERWKIKNKASMSECDGLMRAYSFLAVIYHELGDSVGLDTMIAKMATAKTSRKASAPYAVYEWNQQLLQTKILLAKSAAGDKSAVKKAIKALPKIKSKDERLVSFNKVVKAYQAYALALQFSQEGDSEKFQSMALELKNVIVDLASLDDEVRGKPYYAHYLMSLKTFTVYSSELLGVHASESGIGSVTWYENAIDAQLGPSRLFPPNILYPIEYRLGKYYESKKQPRKALKAYTQALKRMASHQPSVANFKRVSEELVNSSAKQKLVIPRAVPAE